MVRSHTIGGNPSAASKAAAILAGAGGHDADALSGDNYSGPQFLKALVDSNLLSSEPPGRAGTGRVAPTAVP